MTIPLKSPEELKTMAEGKKILERIFQRLLEQVQPGISLRKIETLAVKLIEEQGARPSFMMVPGYRWATCLNINQGVVHGIPNNYKIEEGDLVSLDTGIYYRGFHLDGAWTVIASQDNDPGSQTKNDPGSKEEKERFLKAGKEALRKAVVAARPGNRIGHISQAIEKTIKKAGYFPVKELTGHGIGKKLHEPPPIPCLLTRRICETPLIKKGMALAVEVIYTVAPSPLKVCQDGWTVETEKGVLASLFEDTVLIC